MTSTTFKVNQFKINIKTKKTTRPSGLAGVVWVNPGPEVTITIVDYKINPFQNQKETFKNIGCIMYRQEKFGWAISSTKYWNTFNCFNKIDCEKIGKVPHQYSSEEYAFFALVRYIKSELEKL